MSFWGATVITNLLSAIPWVGQDQVELKPDYLSIIFPVFGLINKKSNQKRRSKEEISSALAFVPYSFLSKFKGLIDGNGYIGITKTPKGYIRIGMTINFNISELKMLQEIQNILKIGRINIFPKHNIVQYSITRTDLQEILIPLLIHHNLYFITETRRQQYDKKLYILKNEIKTFDSIPSSVPSLFNLPTTPLEYTLLPFFFNWIVGYTITEGSFYIKGDKSINFTLKQRSNPVLFEVFKLIFNTNRDIDNNDYGCYNKFAVYSKKDIQNVVNFFLDNKLERLRGNKLDQFNIWLLEIKNSTRYSEIKIR